jgi:hypothetical protein
VSGIEGPVFEELRRAVEQAPELAFPAFNRRSLRRVTDETPAGEAAGEAPTGWTEAPGAVVFIDLRP